MSIGRFYASCAMIALALGSRSPAMGADIVTRPLPVIGSDVSVASCGDRVAILSREKKLISVSADGVVRTIGGSVHPLALFASARRCFAIDGSAGVIDVSSTVPMVVRRIDGTLPNDITASAQAPDGSIWFGIAGSNQLGVIGASGAVAYLDVPENETGSGTLVAAPLRLTPDLSATHIFSRDVQLLSSSPRFVWALTVSNPPNDPSIAFRIDPVTRSYSRVSLESNRRAAGLAARSDDSAVILLSNDRVFVVDPSGIQQQWALPGVARYVAPPRLVSLVTSGADGVDVVSLKDGVLWRLPRGGGTLELVARFPGRPSWIAALDDRLVGVNSDAAEFMTVRR